MATVTSEASAPGKDAGAGIGCKLVNSYAVLVPCSAELRDTLKTVRYSAVRHIHSSTVQHHFVIQLITLQYNVAHMASVQACPMQYSAARQVIQHGTI